MTLLEQTPQSNFNDVLDDTTFLLLQDIHDGNEPLEKLSASSINAKVATLYLAHELNFLQDVAAVAGHETASDLINRLLHELLNKAMVNSKNSES